MSGKYNHQCLSQEKDNTIPKYLLTGRGNIFSEITGGSVKKKSSRSANYVKRNGIMNRALIHVSELTPDQTKVEPYSSYLNMLKQMLFKMPASNMSEY